MLILLILIHGVSLNWLLWKDFLEPTVIRDLDGEYVDKNTSLYPVKKEMAFTIYYTYIRSLRSQQLQR
jgi:hypothetical protein